MRAELIKLGKEKGSGYIAGGLRRLIDDSATAAEKKVEQFNDGTYRGVVFFDLLGAEDVPYIQRLSFAVTKKGNKLYLDYTGTSPQAPGPVNAYSFCLPGVVMMQGLPYAFHDLPTSCGVLKPVVDYKVPPKSLINPDPECSVSNGVVTTFALHTLLHQVFAKMIFDSPDRDTIAAPQGWAVEVMQYVTMNQRGLRNSGAVMDHNAQGQGARANEDGPHSINPPWAALADCLETEWYEKDYPFLFLFRRHPPDSGGFGKYRGGSGIESGWYTRNISFGLVTNVGGAEKVPNSLGLFGGYAGTTGPGVISWGSNVQQLIDKGEPLPKSRQEVASGLGGELRIGLKNMGIRELSDGDVLTSQNSGGGGYGDVLEREPGHVIKDLREGLITPWTARNVYRIEYDEATLTLDEDKTKELREAERAKRAKLGKLYDDFEKQWLESKIESPVFSYFGPWS